MKNPIALRQEAALYEDQAGEKYKEAEALQNKLESGEIEAEKIDETGERIDALIDERKELLQKSTALYREAQRIESLRDISNETPVSDRFPVGGGGGRQTTPDPLPGQRQSVPAEPLDEDRVLRFGFRDIGEQMLAIRNSTVNHQLDPRLVQGPEEYFELEARLQGVTIQQAASGHQQAAGPDGGYLVAPAFSNRMERVLGDPAESLVARTDRLTITGESLEVTTIDETSRVDGKRWGALRGYWKSEAEQMTKSKLLFRTVRWEPAELYVFGYATDKLLRNAPALEQVFGRGAADELNFKIGDAIINGDGAGKPKGILQSGARVTVAKEGSQAAATILYANIVKMWSRCHARSRRNAVWFINQDVEPQLLQLSFEGTSSSVPAYMPANGLSDSPYGTLMGRPVIPLEYCATLGTEGDIILADLMAYATGSAGGIRSAMSIHLRFDYNESAFRWLFAIDGKPWIETPLTPYKGSATISPFVTLATRA